MKENTRSIRTAARRRWIGAAAVAVCAPLLPLAAAQAQAQYPTHSIRFIVPYGPGQGTDTVARIIAEKLTTALKQSVVVENRPGAGGNIGAEVVAKAPPDGYTLLMGTNATNAANAALYPSLPFNPEKDFEAISLVCKLPMIMTAAPGFKPTQVDALIQDSKTHPDTINVGLPSTSAEVILAEFKRLSGARLFAVKYTSSGQALTDMLGNRLQLNIDTLAASLPQIKAGKVQAVAITSGSRNPALPDTPTFAQAGAPGFDLSPWDAIYAPKGTPRAVVDRLNKEINAILADSAVQERLRALGVDPEGGTPAQMQAFTSSEVKKWGDLIRAAGIRAQ
jgi:tripartite-type tricarboxylate transporter receptor subunit TctC